MAEGPAPRPPTRQGRFSRIDGTPIETNAAATQISGEFKPDKVVEVEAKDDNGNTRTHRLYLWTTPLKKEK